MSTLVPWFTIKIELHTQNWWHDGSFLAVAEVCGSSDDSEKLCQEMESLAVHV